MENGEKVSGSPPITFVETRGSQLGGRPKDKKERIHEAMCDLQLAIDGAKGQSGRLKRFEQYQQTHATLARACSVFLRKMVLGDKKDKPQTRLLDDDVCCSLGLTFHSLRKIPPHRKTLDITQEVTGGEMKLAKLNDTTSQSEGVFVIPVAPQKCTISIDWPLPGTASWNENPTREKPWRIHPEELFDTNSRSAMNCIDWLGQQLVMFDNKGITLKEVIRTIANFEGAHALNASRFMRTQDEKDTEVSKNPEVHILNNVRICGFKYTHIVVMECAFYLYKKLVDNKEFEEPEGAAYIPILGVWNKTSEDNIPSAQKVLAYDGGFALSLGEREIVTSHRIRGV